MLCRPLHRIASNGINILVFCNASEFIFGFLNLLIRLSIEESCAFSNWQVAFLLLSMLVLRLVLRLLSRSLIRLRLSTAEQISRKFNFHKYPFEKKEFSNRKRVGNFHFCSIIPHVLALRVRWKLARWATRVTRFKVIELLNWLFKNGKNL